MSSSDRQRKIDEIFRRACELPEEEIARFLQQACGQDQALRRELERLLAAAREHGTRSEEPHATPAALIRDALRGSPPGSHERESTRADRILLYGVLALQLNFITVNQLKQAMEAWSGDKSKPLGQILLAQGAFSAETEKLFTALVDQHILQHGNARKCLERLSSVDEVVHSLVQIRDSELDQSLALLPGESRGSVPSESATTLGEISRTAGRFKILRPHAKGGLGEISVALDAELNRAVALKEIRRELADQAQNRDRFLLEAEVTGGLEHPGIVPVYGLGHYDDGRPFYVMRFIEGDSLKEAIREFRKHRAQLSPGEQNIELRKLLRRLIDVCEAVHYAHSRQVLHRDLKPGNIMLGRYGETLVVDWGLARTLGQSDKPFVGPGGPLVPSSGSRHAPTMIGTMIGTPPYMSPEQAEGRHDDLSPATDVYSLGATLYCILCGQPPFTDNEVTEVLRKVRRGDFPAPREIDPKVPKALEAICLRAMRLKPDERYPTAQGVADDLERWLADEPVTAFADPWTDRFARFVRRNRTGVAAAATILLMGLAGLAALNLVTRNKNAQLTVLNSELTRANDDLAKAQLASAQNFETARDLAAGLIEQAEGDLAQLPQATPYRMWATDQGLAAFQQFIQRAPRDPEILRQLVEVARYSANLDRLQGKRGPETEAKHELARTMAERRIEVEPEEAMAHDQLAETLRDYGNLLRLKGELPRAGELLTLASAAADRLRQADPESPAFKRTAASVRTEFAAVNYELAKFDEALAGCADAIPLLRELADSQDPAATDSPMLLLALLQQSRIQREEKNDLAAAESAAAEALQRARQQSDPAIHPNPTRAVRHTLARSLLELAKVQNAAGKDGGAIDPLLNEAIAVWTALVAEQPETPFYARYLALATAALAARQGQSGDLEAARQSFQQAEQRMQQLVDKNPNNWEEHEAFADVLRAWAELELKHGSPADATQLTARKDVHLQTALEGNPNNPRLKRKADSQ